ncbi:hypothetical protein [uncultured Cyclobacterium sp.]|uniref:hypothetical protein n=1 Tax=uncultured Cyclobacterium sp. TaxID=453820 RepID=UPI0030EE1387
MDIANQGNAARMMVSKVLRKYIQRHAHPNDNRAKIIKLTEEAATVLQKALRKIEKTELDFFPVLGDELEFFNKNMRELMSKNQNTSH